jgi:hypothetical protein
MMMIQHNQKSAIAISATVVDMIVAASTPECSSLF